MSVRFLGSLGLVVGLTVASAGAQEMQWRPVADTSSGQSAGPVSLRAPVADTVPVQQASFTDAPSFDNTGLTRGKGLDSPPQQMPAGPVLNTDKAPGPNPILNNTPPATVEKWGEATPAKQSGVVINGGNGVMVVPNQQGNMVPYNAPGGMVMPNQQGMIMNGTNGMMMPNQQSVIMNGNGGMVMPNQQGVIMNGNGGVVMPNQQGVIMNGNGGMVMSNPQGGMVMSGNGISPVCSGCSSGGGVWMSGGSDCGAGCGCGCGSWWDNLCNCCCGSSCCGSCCDTCCDFCCDGCCAPRNCFWIRGEYLGWTVKGAPTPNLVTTNALGNSPVIGTPGTRVALGGSADDFNFRSGGRFTIGFALPCTCNNFGFEATAFFLPNQTNNSTFSSTGIPSIGRPFTNVGPSVNGFPGNQDAELVAFPNLVAGNVSVKTSNDFYGVEGNFRFPISCGCNYKFDFLTGFRYVQLDEGLQITENLNVLGETNRGVGNIIVVDNFHTRNTFYGGQIGLDAEYRWCRWFVSGTGKLALGDMHQMVSIDGATVFRDGPNAGAERGGLLALPGANIGSYNRDTFAIVPELGLRLGFYFTEHLRAYVGYDVVYASSVVRPGDQIDTNINPTFLPRNGPAVGAPLPAFQYRATDFWAQGFSAGLEWRY